jgi:glutamate dehydrogenase/leucine dehydrogenase
MLSFACSACLAHTQGKRCLVSGSGNVAQYAAEKLLQLGAVVLTMSDSTGYIYEPNGFTMEQIQQVGVVALSLRWACRCTEVFVLCMKAENAL